MSLDIQPGEVAAVVQGSRPTPYAVRLTVKLLSDPEWARAEEAIASQAIFLARLLSGEMPEEIEEAFAACRLSLFPSSKRDLDAICSCPDWGNPCKHGAAAYYLLAEAFDADPFLIFAWRGRSRDRLLADLRSVRDAAAAAERGQVEPAARPRRSAPRRVAGDGAPGSSTGPFWEPGPGFDDVRFDPRSDGQPDSLLREIEPIAPQLGVDLLSLLAPAYQTIAEAAKGWALGRIATSRGEPSSAQPGEDESTAGERSVCRGPTA